MLGNTFGRLFRVTTCGEAYGEALQVIVDGVPPGLELSEKDVQPDLDRRRPGQSKIASPRKETDQVKIVSGVMDGYTTGAPVGMIIYNVDVLPKHLAQYEEDKDLAIPGHADYTYFVKYGRFRDWRGCGRANGRETAARVAGGAVAKKLLARKGVQVVAYTKELAGVRAREVAFEEIVARVESNIARCPDPEAAEQMIERALEAGRQGDTVGGIVEVIARGMPPGVGDPVFDKLSASIAHALMSIGAVKGVEFGAGFALADKSGSATNDVPYVDGERVRFRTNNAGGLLGGITNGEDIVARIVVKPTPLISIAQQTINMVKMEEVSLASKARHDPTIVPRVVPIVEAMVAIVLVDHMMVWRGYSAFVEEG
jgi:chorismate synthase